MQQAKVQVQVAPEVQTPEVQPFDLKPKFVMPEIIIENESWGKKLLRSFLPRQVWPYLNILGDAVMTVMLANWVITKSFEYVSWRGFVAIAVLFWGVRGVARFIAEVYVTLSVRKRNEKIIQILKDTETDLN